MPAGHIVILGNGGAAISAVKTIRKRDKNIKLTMVSKEKESFYSLVALPYYIGGKISRESLLRHGEEFYVKNKIKKIFGKEVIKLKDRTQKIFSGKKEDFKGTKLNTKTSVSEKEQRIENTNLEEKDNQSGDTNIFKNIFGENLDLDDK